MTLGNSLNISEFQFSYIGRTYIIELLELDEICV